MTDIPRQSVRPIQPGELSRTYTTAELLLGVRHVVPEDEQRDREKAEARSRWTKSPERSTQNLTKRHQEIVELARERFRVYFPTMKNMMAKGKMNKEIAAELGISERVVIRYIGKSPELQGLSKQRKENRLGKSKRLAEVRGPIVKMRFKGMRDVAIAKALSMGRSNVRRYMKIIEGESENVAN